MGQIKISNLTVVPDIKTGKMAKCRNSPLDGGISRLSRSAVYRKRALYKRNKTGTAKAAKATAETTKVKPIGGDKNGQERVVPLQKASRFYPTEDIKKPLRHRQTPRPTKLRKLLTPGTIVILLAGRHKGKRVVFLKDLRESGLILVTGPYQVNGVPLRPVPQSYVIATQTKVDVSGVESDKLDADMFKRKKKVHQIICLKNLLMAIHLVTKGKHCNKLLMKLSLVKFQRNHIFVNICNNYLP